MRDGHPAEEFRPASAIRGSYASPAGLTAGAQAMRCPLIKFKCWHQAAHRSCPVMTVMIRQVTAESAGSGEPNSMLMS